MKAIGVNDFFVGPRLFDTTAYSIDYILTRVIASQVFM